MTTTSKLNSNTVLETVEHPERLPAWQRVTERLRAEAEKAERPKLGRRKKSS